MNANKRLKNYAYILQRDTIQFLTLEKSRPLLVYMGTGMNTFYIFAHKNQIVWLSNSDNCWANGSTDTKESILKDPFVPWAERLRLFHQSTPKALQKLLLTEVS